MTAREFVLTGEEIQSGYMDEAATKSAYSCKVSLIHFKPNLCHRATESESYICIIVFTHDHLYICTTRQQGISGGIRLVQC